MTITNDPGAARTVNPATGELFAVHPFQSASEVDSQLDSAVGSLADWEGQTGERRAQILARLGDVLRARTDDFAATMTAEMGKPITQARAEVTKCADACDWYAEHGAGLIADEPTSVENGAAHVAYEPLGLVLGIMPWNYPCWQAVRAMVPILLSGNGFVLKHAPNSVSTALKLVSAFEEAGGPSGLVSSLNVRQADIRAVIEDDRIAAVTLTGSGRAGSAVAAQAGAVIKKTVLELGGSDPFIVLSDADLDRAVAAAVTARFQNSGQTCIAAKRIIVEASIADAFTARLILAVGSLHVGDPTLEDTFIGPLAREDLRTELANQVERSIAEGAVPLVEGGAFGLPGAVFFRPFVLGEVRPGMAAFDEETFGPVAAVTVAASADDAIRLANTSAFGLSSAIWTADPDRGRALARRLRTGGVFINGVARSDPRVPIGGIRKSGYGRELSHFGVREFTNAKLIWAEE